MEGDPAQNFWDLIPRRTLVLICGYARAGKDTLGTGILEWSEKNSTRFCFADALKDSLNLWLENLGLQGDFFEEKFKTEHRKMLVSAGEFARSLDSEVFAREVCRLVEHATDDDGIPFETVVCTDWRYFNELTTCQKLLIPLGWRIKTVYVHTAGVEPANETEKKTINEISDLVKFDYEFYFQPNTRQKIIAEGKMLSAYWML